MITVVAMGSKQGDLTMDGLTAINNADIVVAKSNKTHVAQTLSALKVDFVSCDDIYQDCYDFDQLNQQKYPKFHSNGRIDSRFWRRWSGSCRQATHFANAVDLRQFVGMQQPSARSVVCR